MRRALVVAAALVATTAWGDAKHPNPFLSQAKVFATQGEGDKCLKRLIQAEQKWKHNDKKDRAEIELYGGICGYLTGETQAAEVSFKNAVKIDPKLELPKDLGPGIEQLWTKATRKSAPLAAGNPPPAAAKKEDPKPRVAEAAPAPKRDDAPPPPVAPAAQKERKLTPDEQLDRQLSAEASATAPPEAKSRNIVVPVVLGIGAVGAGVGAVILGLQAKSHERQYQSLDTFYSDAQAIGAQARTEALVTNILFAAAGALLLGALISFLVSG